MMRKSDWKKAGIFFWTVFLITVILPGCSGGNSGAEDEAYRASSGLPCRETLSLTADTADTITFLIDIFPDTEGSVVVEILERD